MKCWLGFCARSVFLNRDAARVGSVCFSRSRQGENAPEGRFLKPTLSTNKSINLHQHQVLKGNFSHALVHLTVTLTMLFDVVSLRKSVQDPALGLLTLMLNSFSNTTTR